MTHMLAMLVLGLLLNGDRLVERGTVAFGPGPSEGAVPEPFRLEAAAFPFEREVLRETPGYRVSAVRFPSPVVSGDEANDTVHAEYFEPIGGGGGRRPAVVVLHILGADFALSRYLAARLADRGVAALFVQLPYYGERRPPGLKEPRRFLSADIERSTLAMRQGICDVRRAAAWLASRPEIDPKRLGVTGISLGGIVSAIAAAVDPELNRAALLLAGGDLAEILWTMPEAARYRQLWLDSGRTKEDFAALTRPYDPLTYAEGLRGKHVLMIAGATDEVIPPRSTTALWDRAGRPPIRWYDCGHYSAVAYLLPAIRATVEFFAGGSARRVGPGLAPGSPVPPPDPGATSMNPRSEDPVTDRPGWEQGQRLYCANCRSEIEIINPTTAAPNAQVLRCCGQDMQPSTTVSTHVNVTD